MLESKSSLLMGQLQLGKFEFSRNSDTSTLTELEFQVSRHHNTFEGGNDVLSVVVRNVKVSCNHGERDDDLLVRKFVSNTDARASGEGNV